MNAETTSPVLAFSAPTRRPRRRIKLAELEVAIHLLFYFATTRPEVVTAVERFLVGLDTTEADSRPR